MGTWDEMQPPLAQIKSIVDDTDDELGAAKEQVSDLTAANSQLTAEKAELERQLAECQGGEPGPGPGPEPEPDGIGLPPTGKIYMGCSYNGMAGHLAISGNKHPHISHDYARSGSEMAGRISRLPAGCIPLINFKPAGAMGPSAYKAILAGSNNASIDASATAIKKWMDANPGKPFFFAPIHEPENDEKPPAGQTIAPGDADYARAFRFIVERTRRIADPVIVWNMMGFEGHGLRYNTLYPGDDVVDWLASDPYVRTVASVDTWNELANAPSTNFPGFYSWGKTKGKPFMLAEWGIGIAVKDTAAPKLLSVGQLDVLQRDMPLVRALVYWNEVGTVDYRLQNIAGLYKTFLGFAPFQF